MAWSFYPRAVVCIALAVFHQESQQPPRKAALPPLTMAQVLVWMDSGWESSRVAQLVERQGIDFVPTEGFLEELRGLHAKPVLLEKLRNARPKSPSPDPAGEQSAYAHLLACLRNAQPEPSSKGESECLAAETSEPSAAFFALGRQALTARQFKSSQQFFQKAIGAAPLVADNHNDLGLAFQDAGDLKAAEAEYREAARLDPDYETPVSNLASLFLKLKEPERAESYARHATVMPYASAMAHELLGTSLILQSKVREGMKELYEAERLEPDSPSHHRQIAEMLLAGRSYEGALRKFRQVAQLDPNDVRTHVMILRLLLVLRKKDEATAECQTLKTLVPNAQRKSCEDLAKNPN